MNLVLTEETVEIYDDKGRRVSLTPAEFKEVVYMGSKLFLVALRDPNTCPKCNGRGFVYIDVPNDYGTAYEAIQKPCSQCNGEEDSIGTKQT